jgi:hypothetical protein
MANEFKTKIARVGDSNTVVYTVPSATTATVIGLTVSNIKDDTNIFVDVFYTAANSSVAYMVKGAEIAIGGGMVPVGGDQKLVMEASTTLSIKSSSTSSADVLLSVLEIS